MEITALWVATGGGEEELLMKDLERFKQKEAGVPLRQGAQVQPSRPSLEHS